MRPAVPLGPIAKEKETWGNRWITFGHFATGAVSRIFLQFSRDTKKAPYLEREKITRAKNLLFSSSAIYWEMSEKNVKSNTICKYEITRVILVVYLYLFYRQYWLFTLGNLGQCTPNITSI